MTVKVSVKGSIVIPAEFRKKYNLTPGTAIQLVDYGGVLCLVPPSANPVQDAAGMLKGGSSLTQALMAERRAERERESRR